MSSHVMAKLLNVLQHHMQSILQAAVVPQQLRNLRITDLTFKPSKSSTVNQHINSREFTLDFQISRLYTQVWNSYQDHVVPSFGSRKSQ